jgi:hypothetical protein
MSARKMLQTVVAIMAVRFAVQAEANIVLLQDTFTNNTGSAKAVTNYNFAGQSGSLAPLAYLAPDTTSRSNLVTTAGRLLLLGKANGASAVGLSQNIETNKMRIEWDMSVLSGGTLTSKWAAVTIGNTNSASQSGTSLFSVRLNEAGQVAVATNGSAGAINFANAANLAGSMSSFAIEFNNTAWDGTGTATVDVYVNKGSGWTQLDLNGAAAGLSLSRTGFTDNYISLSAQFNTLNTAYNGVEFDNLVITEISTVKLSLFLISFIGLWMIKDAN